MQNTHFLSWRWAFFLFYSFEFSALEWFIKSALNDLENKETSACGEKENCKISLEKLEKKKLVKVIWEEDMKDWLLWSNSKNIKRDSFFCAVF